jgi:hypothetical protein
MAPPDEVQRRLEELDWAYADGDPAALAELARRIAAVGRTPEGFLTYSQLVHDVTFRLPNVAGGEPFEIHEWTGLDRAIIGIFLGRIAAESYRRGRFFASALVIGTTNNGPGEGLYTLAEQVGLLLPSSGENARLRFWFEQIQRARAWYASH